MVKIHIDYTRSNGIEYASVCNSIRANGKVTKVRLRYLGRVIDKENGVYKSKENGIYMYDLDTDTISALPPDYLAPEAKRKNEPRKRKELGLSFGDVFLISELIKRSGLTPSIDAINYKNMDTLNSMILFYVTQNRSNCHAHTWWTLSYASIMYPNAKMESQRVSELLVDIGSEEAKRDFFTEYIKFLGGEQVQNPRKLKMVVDDGILIDSTGLPNVARLPCTAISNHNGKISEEVRLIYVVQQRTGFPLFYRYVPGNVIDASTVRKTINELKKYKVNTNWALLDAGYYTAENADELCNAGISFVTRVGTNRKIYKNALRDYKSTLRNPDNIVVYEKRLYYIVRFECMIGTNEDHRAYGYLCLDESMCHAELKTVLSKAEGDGVLDAKTREELDEKGLFVLVSTRKLKKEEILPLYFTRDQVEKIFEIVKQYAHGLPVNQQNQETFRGHLLLTFISAVIHKLLANALYKTGYSAMDTIITTHDLQCLVYPDEVLINEAKKEIADPFRKLKIKLPDSIPITGQANISRNLEDTKATL